MAKSDETAVRKAAEQLRAAWESSTPCDPIRDDLPDDSLEAAYAVQDLNTEAWLEQGRRLTGRKIGLTARAVQKQLGVDQPDYGMLFADMAVADGEEVPLAKLCQPRVEGEIAFALSDDLDDPALTLADVMARIDYAVPAVEIVESRIKDWDIRIQDTIADNASSGHYVLGAEPRLLGEFDPRLCGMVLETKGEPVSLGAGAACLGNPLNAVLWLARKMVEVGRPLGAGDIVMSGALGPMVPVAGTGVYELRINGLGSVRAVFTGD